MAHVGWPDYTGSGALMTFGMSTLPFVWVVVEVRISRRDLAGTLGWRPFTSSRAPVRPSPSRGRVRSIRFCLIWRSPMWTTGRPEGQGVRRVRTSTLSSSISGYTTLTPKPCWLPYGIFGRKNYGRDGRWRLKTSSDGVSTADELVATGPRYKIIRGPKVIRATPRARQGWSTFAHVCARAADADVGQQLHHPKVRETCRLRLRRTHPPHPHPGQAWS